MCPRPVARQQHGREVLDVAGCPLPGVLAGERLEAPDQLQPRTDRLVCQQPAALLARPAILHRLEHGRGLVEVDHTLGQHQMRRTRQVQPAPLPLSPSLH